MKQITVFFLFLMLTCMYSPCHAKITAGHLTCEYYTKPVAIDHQIPKLGWIIQSDEYGITQSAYRIMVADDIGLLAGDSGNIWDSGKIDSDRSIQVPYGGQPLGSGKKYYWKVKVWDQSGRESAWSEISSWQMGLLHPEDWSGARWIGYEEIADSMRIVPGVHGSGNKLGEKGMRRPVIPLFRKSFDLNRKVASATLYVSGLGQYEAYLNGEKTGNDFLTPGWTDYDQTVFYNIYDVTADLRKGENVLGVIVGNGFYHVNRERYRKLVIAYGMPKMICKLAVTYDDGSSETIVSGNDWKTSPSPVTYTSIYGGEDYDARLEQQGWNEPGFGAAGWNQALPVKAPEGKLIADRDYPVKICAQFTPKNIGQLTDSCYLYDFGQNASGIVELRIKGKKGRQVRLIPAELINDDSTANQRATGSPYCWTYTLKGDGVEVWRPRFTYYGFRYVLVNGAVPQSSEAAGDLPVVQELTLLHTRNAEPQNGTFECSSSIVVSPAQQSSGKPGFALAYPERSNELFNRIYALINWAIKSNLQSVVTDCPHREKLGWMEQTFLMGNGINFNHEVYHLYRKLVFDMMDSQTTEGLIPSIAPEYVNFGDYFRDSPEWGSAGVILPWLLYRWYGDEQILEEAWPMMTRYVAYLEGKSDQHILSYGLGDWYDLGPERPGVAQLTPVALTATAIYYDDVKLLAAIAGVLQKTTEQEQYQNMAEEIREAFNQKFFDQEKKVYASGSQTAMAMPLCTGLVEKPYREQVLANLEDSIRANGKALTAGDVGFHYLVEALTEGGASQLLFEMNNRDDVPGYGYQLKKGATTLTESWAALREVSNNHLMLGHLMEWFYQGIGGIRQKDQSTAFRNILIQPEVVGDLTSAKTSFHSPYGEITTEWEKSDQSYTLKVGIPGNTYAEVRLPFEGEVSVNDGQEIPALKYAGIHNGRMVYQTGSGTYVFKVKLK